MNAAQIQCFLTAAKHLNFSRAAEELYLTQPSVSRYISQLEEEWGVKLFARSGRSVILTPQGEDYYRLCLRCAQDFAALRARHAEENRSDCLSFQYTVFPAWNITDLLRENADFLRERHPDWNISMRICQAGSMVEELRRGDVDLAFTLGGVLQECGDLSLRTLVDLPQVLLYSRHSALGKRAGLAPKDFAGEDFLFVPDEVFTMEMIRRQARSLEKRYGFTPHIHLLDTPDELPIALEMGQGVALMDYWSRYRSNPALGCLGLDLTIPAVLAWRREPKRPGLDLFVRDTAEFFRTREIQGSGPNP